MCLAAACAKQSPSDIEVNPAPVQGEQVFVEFTAVPQNICETKSYLDGLKPVWEMTDCLSVFGSSKSNAKFTAVSVSGSSAAFAGMTDPTGPYTAVYPYSDGNALTSDGAAITVPNVQTLEEGKNVAQGALMSVAAASDLNSTLSFRNVTALVKLTVADDGITSLMLVSDGTALSGKAVIDPSTAEVKSIKEGKNTVTLLPSGETFAKGDYYIAVLPCSSEGITASATRKEDARRGEKSSMKSFKTVRGQVLNIGEFSVSSLDWSYRIYSRKDFDAYAADAANWSIEEDINVCADIDMGSEPWHTLDDRLSVSGTFEGNGHCIYNIHVEETDNLYAGIFGRYYKNIRNLTLGSRDGVTYDGVSYVKNSYKKDDTSWSYAAGCIVWPGDNCLIENVRNFSSVSTTSTCTHKSRTGGVISWIDFTGITVKGCENYGSVSVADNTGTDSNINCGGVISGISGTGVTVDGCTNFGTVTSAHIYTKAVGGVVGQNYSAGANLIIKNCRNKGEVSIRTSVTHKDEASVGGISGKSICKAGADPVIITNCVNDGYIYTNAIYYTGAGGIVGWSYGSDISECTNNGKVENNSGSGRFQAVGGIVGIFGQDYGANTVRKCTNNGEVYYHGKSFGQTANSSSGKVRGVNAGGIVGLVYPGTNEIYGNTNCGNVTGENGYVGTKSFPKAYMFVGGIVGYDLGEIQVFRDNVSMPEATITSKVTDSTSSYTNSYAVAGGVIGYQKNSTMESGTSYSTVLASYVSSTGLLYAGTVSGWNKMNITMCYYAGTVNGAPATESNIVGSGNAPKASAPATASDTDHYDGEAGKIGTEDGTWD